MNRVRKEMSGPPSLGKEVLISVVEATELIGRLGPELYQETVSLSGAGGRVLAHAVLADRDGPPFERVAMDGIAIAFDSYAQGCPPGRARVSRRLTLPHFNLNFASDG